MGGMMFMWIFWIALIILVIYLATRLLNDRLGKVSTEESALDILKKELAKGNITEEEFDRKKKLL
ncbi:SHOCT domain-containing protein [Trichococcus shcherbakoviae]|nr:SHOCT domain-containing protein [Trichococcus shcherbakoviae]